MAYGFQIKILPLLNIWYLVFSYCGHSLLAPSSWYSLKDCASVTTSQKAVTPISDYPFTQRWLRKVKVQWGTVESDDFSKATWGIYVWFKIGTEKYQLFNPLKTMDPVIKNWVKPHTCGPQGYYENPFNFLRIQKSLNLQGKWNWRENKVKFWLVKWLWEKINSTRVQRLILWEKKHWQTVLVLEAIASRDTGGKLAKTDFRQSGVRP